MICNKDIQYLKQSISEFYQGFRQYRPQILESQVKDYVAHFFDCDDYSELIEYALKKDNIDVILNSLNVKKQMIDNFKKKSNEFSILELETVLNQVNFTRFIWFKFSVKNTDAEITQFTSQNKISLINVNKHFLLEITYKNKKYCGFIGKIISSSFFEEQSHLLYFSQKGHISYGKILTNELDHLHATPYVALFFEKDVLLRSHYEQLFMLFESTVDYSIQTQINLLKHWFSSEKKSFLSKNLANTDMYSIKINPYGQNTETFLFNNLNQVFDKLDLKDNISIVFHHSLKIVNEVDIKIIKLTEDVDIQATYNVSINSNSYNQIIFKRYIDCIMNSYSLSLHKENSAEYTDRLFLNCFSQKKKGYFDLINEQIHSAFSKLIAKSVTNNTITEISTSQNKFKETIQLPFTHQKDNYLIIGSNIFAFDMLQQIKMSMKFINFKAYYNVLLSKDKYLSYADKAKLLRTDKLEKIHLENKTVTKNFIFEYLSYLNFQFRLKLDIEQLKQDFERITFDNQLLFIEYLDLIEQIQSSAKQNQVDVTAIMFTENYSMNVTDSKLFNSLIFMYMLIQLLNDNSANMWVLNNIQELELLNYAELIDMLFRYRSNIYNKSSICFVYDKMQMAIEHNAYSHIFKMLIGEKQVLDEDNYSTHFIMNKVVNPSKHLITEAEYHHLLYVDDKRSEYYYIQKNK